MWNYLITAMVLGPSATLVGWALYVHFTQPDHDDFLENEDYWGRQ